MKRRLHAGDRDITKAANVIYRAAFHGEAMPRGWRVVVPGTIRAHRFGTHVGYGDYGGGVNLGRCSWHSKTILMSRRCWKREGKYGWLGVLVHEFVHMRCPSLIHGREFERLVAAAMERVWVP